LSKRVRPVKWLAVAVLKKVKESLASEQALGLRPVFGVSPSRAAERYVPIFVLRFGAGGVVPCEFEACE